MDINGLSIGKIPSELTFNLIADNVEWESKQSTRATAQYGYYYNFFKKSCLPVNNGMLPKWLEPFLDFAQQFATKKLNQCIINKYTFGQSIASHIDAPIFGDCIVVLCFGEGVMKFSKGGLSKLIEIPSNHYYIMKDDARHAWKHELVPVKNDRISITFRSV